MRTNEKFCFVFLRGFLGGGGLAEKDIYLCWQVSTDTTLIQEHATAISTIGVQSVKGFVMQSTSVIACCTIS